MDPFLFFAIHLLISWLYNPSLEKSEAFTLNKENQRIIDSLKRLKIAQSKLTDSIYPFNPNYISDFKAYQLDIPMSAVKNIRAYRAAGFYLFSAKDAKQVTGLSDTEMNRISPYLKFLKTKYVKKTPKTMFKKEINEATAKMLQQVYGIGPVLSQRIIAMRNQLGGFLIKDQLDDVWGLKPEVQ